MQRLSPTNHKTGFTLIEVLVSLSLFTVVVTICVSSLYALIDANARSRNAQSVATNLSFMLDSMTREIRTGTHYYCATNPGGVLPPERGGENATRDCPDGGAVFSFNEGGRSLTSGEGSRRIAYRAYQNRLQRRLGTGEWTNITAEEVVIEKLTFAVDGSEVDDDFPPVVRIYLKGRVGTREAYQSEFDIQTTITQRLLDI